VAEAIVAFGRSNCGGTVRAGSFRFATVALALALLHAAPLYAEEEKANLYEEEGARLFVAKSYEGAIKQYSQAYRLDPQPRYLFNIGQAYRRMGLAAEPKPDATIRADLVGYMEQYYASLEGKERPRFSNEPEPAPFLAAEELLDAEELIAQYVRDYKAGNNAAATELMDQLMQVLAKRRDPILYYYIASGFDQVKRKSDALSYYKKFIASDPADATLRSRAAARIDDLTPPPPGQKYLEFLDSRVF
jgi:tetratricopeptide (TPR) repeat protein